MDGWGGAESKQVSFKILPTLVGIRLSLLLTEIEYDKKKSYSVKN